MVSHIRNSSKVRELLDTILSPVLGFAPTGIYAKAKSWLIMPQFKREVSLARDHTNSICILSVLVKVPLWIRTSTEHPNSTMVAGYHTSQVISILFVLSTSGSIGATPPLPSSAITTNQTRDRMQGLETTTYLLRYHFILLYPMIRFTYSPAHESYVS